MFGGAPILSHDEEFDQKTSKILKKKACKRCFYNEAKPDGVRNRRRFILENFAGAQSEIIGYMCDVGIRSLLRSISEFY